MLYWFELKHEFMQSKARSFIPWVKVNVSTKLVSKHFLNKHSVKTLISNGYSIKANEFLTNLFMLA